MLHHNPFSPPFGKKKKEKKEMGKDPRQDKKK